MCGKGFTTLYQLCQHRKSDNHQRLPKRKCAPRNRRGTGKLYANALMKTLAQELSSIGEDTSDKSDEDTQADSGDQTETQDLLVNTVVTSMKRIPRLMVVIKQSPKNLVCQPLNHPVKSRISVQVIIHSK